MSDAPRRKSPRAPSMALDEALDRVQRAYERERLHPAPVDVVAQNLGYKSAQNGAALAALASLRYFGLVERPKEGVLAVTKAYEHYRFTPDEVQRRGHLLTFLRTPTLYAELLEKYAAGLPSDPNLRYELIQRGFSPATAESVLVAFRRSVDFAGADASSARPALSAEVDPDRVALPTSSESTPMAPQAPATDLAAVAASNPLASAAPVALAGGDTDQIPIRLPGGRRAWIVVPTPFYEADKARLKAQIDLLLTLEDEQQGEA